jgi:hypothetical protein
MSNTTDTEDVSAWRTQRLEQAGFRHELADELSHRCGYDLHALIELVERGCPPELAVRILAPLAGDERPC